MTQFHTLCSTFVTNLIRYYTQGIIKKKHNSTQFHSSSQHGCHRRNSNSKNEIFSLQATRQSLLGEGRCYQALHHRAGNKSDGPEPPWPMIFDAGPCRGMASRVPSNNSTDVPRATFAFNQAFGCVAMRCL